MKSKFLLKEGPPQPCVCCKRLAEMGVLIFGMAFGEDVDGVLCRSCHRLQERDEMKFWEEWRKRRGV